MRQQTTDVQDEGTDEGPFVELSHEWKVLPQQIVEIAATKPASGAPEGMVKVPGGSYIFKVDGIEIEGSDDTGVDVQYAWEDTPRRFHEHRMEIKPFYIDKYPVTNEEFKKFLDATHYRPTDSLNFLKDWANGTYPAGWAKKPVTWVSFEDARAYAQWAGKRLPHEWEWQFAAQGTDGRAYPWGNTWQASAVPVPDQGRTMRSPDSVDAHASGASPFGVMDIVGNVWQWTDEYVDEHTRARHSARGQLLPTSRLNLVFSSGISERSTWEALAHGAELRPVRCYWLSLH